MVAASSKSLSTAVEWSSLPREMEKEEDLLCLPFLGIKELLADRDLASREEEMTAAMLDWASLLSSAGTPVRAEEAEATRPRVSGLLSCGVELFSGEKDKEDQKLEQICGR